MQDPLRTAAGQGKRMAKKKLLPLWLGGRLINAIQVVLQTVPVDAGA